MKNKIIRTLREIIYNLSKILKIALLTDKKLTIGYYLSAAVGAILPILASLIAKYLIDAIVVVQRSAPSSVPLILTIILGTYYFIMILSNLFQWGLNQTYFDYLLRYKMQNELSVLFSRKLTELDIAHLEDPETRNLITTAQETYTWRVPDFLRMFSYAFSSFVTYATAAIALLPIDPIIPIALTLAVFPRIYFRTRQGSIQWSIYGSGAPQTRKLYYFSWLLATTNALREIKIFQSQSALIQRYKELQSYLFTLNKRPLDRYLKLALFAPIFEGLVLLLIVWMKLPAVTNGALSVGTFTFIVTVASTLIGGASAAGTNLGELYEHNLYVNQYLKVLALPKLIPETSNPKVIDTSKPPKIEFRHVSFAYPRGKEILHDISFVIDPGDSVAFVGANGAGKSTIIKLLCRFYDVSGGAVLINDIDIKELSLPQWYSMIGTLFQDFVQYHFTVRENIMLGDTQKHDEALVYEAAKKSGALSFIEQLPAQFDQPLGREFEEGEELSGGQWQKLAIARAFYQSAPVLIMDEPTSAIDAEAEYEIFSNLENQYKNKTLVLVSHRFSTVRNANTILVIDKGRVIEHGDHASLMKRDGRYAKIFAAQAKGYR